MAFVRFADLGQLSKRGIFQPVTQMAEGILVGHQFDSQLAAARVQLEDFFGSDWPPTAPDWCIIAVSEGMFDVQLELADFEIGQMFDQLQQSIEVRDAPPRNVQHHSAFWESRKIANRQP